MVILAVQYALDLIHHPTHFIKFLSVKLMYPLTLAVMLIYICGIQFGTYCRLL